MLSLLLSLSLPVFASDCPEASLKNLTCKFSILEFGEMTEQNTFDIESYSSKDGIVTIDSGMKTVEVDLLEPVQGEYFTTTYTCENNTVKSVTEFVELKDLFFEGGRFAEGIFQIDQKGVYMKEPHFKVDGCDKEGCRMHWMYNVIECQVK